eukprot:scaffold50676_cov32-Prasinocladus_malaysianus.AAC.2
MGERCDVVAETLILFYLIVLFSPLTTSLPMQGIGLCIEKIAAVEWGWGSAEGCRQSQAGGSVRAGGRGRPVRVGGGAAATQAAPALPARGGALHHQPPGALRLALQTAGRKIIDMTDI